MTLAHTVVYLTLVISIIERGNAAYTLKVRIYSFDSSDRCPECIDFLRPGCCDNFSNTRFCNGNEKCDNYFFYCLQAFGTVASLNIGSEDRCGDNNRFGKLSGVNTDSTPLNFTQDHVLGLPNPIPLRGPTTTWEGIQLCVEIRDADFGGKTSDEFIDRFAINVNRIPIGIETTPTLYNGTFGFASLTLSFEVECFLSYYFPACEANGCQNFGNCTCFPGYTGVDCEIEINECMDVNCPEDTICVDELNSISCVPLNIDDCIGVNCSGNGRCVDGVNSFQCFCDPEYTGELCEIPMPLQGCGDCNGNGVCDNATFSCNCSTGYSGEFCQQSNSTEYSLLTYLLPVGLVSVIVAAVIICAVITNRLRIFCRKEEHIYAEEHIYEEVEGEKESFSPFHSLCLKV